MPDKIVTPDGDSLMYRAFHALQTLDDRAGRHAHQRRARLYDDASAACSTRKRPRRRCGGVRRRQAPTLRAHDLYADYKAQPQAHARGTARSRIPSSAHLLALHGRCASSNSEGYRGRRHIGHALRAQCEERGVESRARHRRPRFLPARRREHHTSCTQSAASAETAARHARVGAWQTYGVSARRS